MSVTVVNEMPVKMSDETRRLIIKLAYRLFQRAWENYIYEDEDPNIAVSFIDGSIIITDYRINNVYVIFFKDDGKALEFSDELIEKYENDDNMNIEEFIESHSIRILAFYLEPYVFKVYRSR